MIFSRVSIEFGPSHSPTSTLLLINDEAGDVNLQKSSNEAINRLGYFRLADTSPCPGASSSPVRHSFPSVRPTTLMCWLDHIGHGSGYSGQFSFTESLTPKSIEANFRQLSDSTVKV